MTPEGGIVKRAKRIQQRKDSALEAFGDYIQRNMEILVELPSADAGRQTDLIGRLTPSDSLKKISKRLRSAGVNEGEFGDRVNAVLDLAHDKMIQPEERGVIVTNLLSVFLEARSIR